MVGILHGKFTYTWRKKPVYPKVFAFLAWDLEPEENDTFVWQQIDEFDGECKLGIYIVKDTQGWGLACTFEITSTPITEFPISAYLMILLIVSASSFALRRFLKRKPHF
ncbi:MAG: hypothetical protein QXK26_03895 [Candidatus Bathyarchaeia archaeon]